MVVANNTIDNDKKCTSNAGKFDHHADVAVLCDARRPIEHFQGFTRSHCMSPLGKCLRRFAPAAAIVDEIIAKL